MPDEAPPDRTGKSALDMDEQGKRRPLLEEEVVDMNDVEVFEVGKLCASFGAGRGSRAANANARGRGGSRRNARGSTTRLRNRIQGAQGQNRGRGSRARRQALNDLATRAQGNTRGNLTRRQARALTGELNALLRQIRSLGG